MAAPLLLMVSGGSDSVAMARLAAAVAPQQGNPLRILHVNHLLRGSDAQADEAFVCALAAELGIPCVVHRANVAARALASGQSVEQAGRAVRYDAASATLDAFCAELGVPASCGRILTAHTANDRAETLLQRLIVGGGGSSLASIPVRNGRVLRPLLACTREELQSFLRTLATTHAGAASATSPAHTSPHTMAHTPLHTSPLWREDTSNQDTAYSRAFVRHRLLPLLSNQNPRVIETLGRTATILEEEGAWLDQQAGALLPLVAESFKAPLPLVRRAVYLACNQAIAALAPNARITFEHVELIAREGARNGFACQIPGGIEVRTQRGALHFTKAKPPRHNPAAP